MMSIVHSLQSQHHHSSPCPSTSKHIIFSTPHRHGRRGDEKFEKKNVQRHYVLSGQSMVVEKNAYKPHYLTTPIGTNSITNTYMTVFDQSSSTAQKIRGNTGSQALYREAGLER